MPGTLNVGGHNIITHSGTSGAGDVTINVQDRLVLDSSGNVGIGTTPTYNLDLSSNSTRIRIKDADTPIASGPITGIRFEGSDGAHGLLGTFGSTDFRIFSAAATVFSTGGISTSNEAMRIDSSGNLKFNSGYGSVATAYGCRAWVNFNGTGTVAIRSSGNVSSITDYGSGDYLVNFGTSMPHANYSTLITNTSFATNSTQRNSGIKGTASSSVTTYTTSSVRIIVGNPSSASLEDNVMMCVAVFC